MLNSKENSIIILIGFMGSGKTSVGEKLAKKLGCNFIDSDNEIEKSEGMSVTDIFETQGENYFRTLESNFIQNFHQTNCILATGGGLPCYNDNLAILKKLGTVIYLNTSFENVVMRLKKSEPLRPKAMFNQKITIEDNLLKLYNARKPIYEKADIEIDGARGLNDILKDILISLNN